MPPPKPPAVPTRQPAAGNPPAPERAERQAAALRENLRRRKAQARARKQPAGASRDG